VGYVYLPAVFCNMSQHKFRDRESEIKYILKLYLCNVTHYFITKADINISVYVCVCLTSASYMGGTWFKSRPGDRLS
jgi:hypothetical protein